MRTNYNNNHKYNQNQESDNRRFIYTIPEDIALDPTLKATDLKIYMIINSFMHTTGKAYASNNWISSKIHIDRRNVIASINRLIKKGYIVKSELNGRRYLSINITPMPSIDEDRGVIQTSPPSDLNITPPSDPNITLLNKNNINKKINTYGDFKKSPSVDNFSKEGKKEKDTYKSHEAFMMFYSKYPNKQKPKEAFKAFLKVSPMDMTDKEFAAMLIKDVSNRIDNDRRWKTRQYIPHPANYLNSEYWEGDIVKDPKKPSYPTKEEQIENNKQIKAREDKARKMKEEEIAAAKSFNPKDLINKCREMLNI